MEIEIRARNDIPTEFTWNAESVYESTEAWQIEADAVSAALSSLGDHQALLKVGSAELLAALRVIHGLVQRAVKLIVYAAMAHEVDTTDQSAAEMWGKAQSVMGQTMAAAAFLDPELIAIGEGTLREWMAAEPGLELYDHYMNDLFRKQAHVRSSEVETLLGMLQEPFSGAYTTAGMLTDSDFQFPPALGADGNALPLTQSSRDQIRGSPDRLARKSAWENFADTYLSYKNTLASNLSTSIRQNVFEMRARGHTTTLGAALFDNNIPDSVYNNLIQEFRNNVSTWHRYWALKRRALGLDKLQPYDVWAPLTDDPPRISYQQAVDWILEGLAPLGKDYVTVMRRGCLEDRWVDVYPNVGKRQGAFSSGSQGTYPFIVMSYNDDTSSLSTLAHELGHSMHSYLAWQEQPFVYSEYSIFVAEVASNFHQAMVRAYLLENTDDVSLHISIIEEAMSNFYRYFLVMPTLARFELEMHERVERGEGLTADLMIQRTAELFKEPYGDEMEFDSDRVGISWAQYLHLYADYYVYQYATGISGAHALANRVLEGEQSAAEDYLKFLQTGGSVYPLEALKLAGVDLSKPDPVAKTFEIMGDLVDRLEQLLNQ